MRNDTARALAVLIGSDSQIQRLHEKELALGYCLPPLDVAQFCGEESVKHFWGCPDDYSKIQRWSKKCDHLIEKIRKEDNLMFEAHTNINVQATHEFDLTVRAKRNELDFSYDRYAEKPAEKTIQDFDSKKETVPPQKKDFWDKV